MGRWCNDQQMWVVVNLKFRVQILALTIPTDVDLARQINKSQLDNISIIGSPKPGVELYYLFFAFALILTRCRFRKIFILRIFAHFQNSGINHQSDRANFV